MDHRSQSEDNAQEAVHDPEVAHVDADRPTRPHSDHESRSIRPARTEDARLIYVWGVSLQAQGWSTSSVNPAKTRLLAFARRLPNGLLAACTDDVVVFYRERERVYLSRYARRLGADQPPIPFLQHPTWAIWRSNLKSFYRWAERHGLLSPTSNPTRGLREEPRIATGAPLNARWYERLLHEPSLNRREAALLWLLAHGLGIAEVCQLRPTDVNLEEKTVHVDGSRRARVVPLSDQAITKLRPWVSARYHLGSSWLFPAPSRHHPISPRTARHILAQVARRTFAEEPEICKYVSPGGFRHLFVRRAARAGMRPAVLMKITGLSPASALRVFVQQATQPELLHAELEKVTRLSTNSV